MLLRFFYETLVSSLTQFSVDGQGCVPSLFLTWSQTMCLGPAAGHHGPKPLPETLGHSQASLGQECVHLLLQELQNCNSLLNNHWQENVKSHQIKIPHGQEQRQIPNKMVQFSSVAQLCPTLSDPMNCSTPGLPVHHQLPEFTQTHVHRVSDAIQPSHPLLSPSPPALNPSQHQSLFQWVNSSHEMAKVLEFQL